MEDMRAAFLSAYEEHADALYRYCFFKINDADLAKDLLQDTFTKTWQYIASGKKIDNVKAFLYRSVNNQIIDEYRKKKHASLDAMSEESGFDPEYTGESSYFERLDGERAIKLLVHLPHAYRDAIFMRYVEGLTLSEIAEVLEESENTISVRIHRGIKQLRELFDENI
jgi:RNA polymerase sigma-70 factor, ECF subfamily